MRGAHRPQQSDSGGWAVAEGIEGVDAVECIDVRAEPERLSTGRWFVVGEFDGPVRAWRFARYQSARAATGSGQSWRGPDRTSWSTSLDRSAYLAAVESVRDAVRDGDVYQANVCRVLSAPLGATGAEPDARALFDRLAQGNPSPYAAAIHVPDGGGVDPVWVVSASPELYLARVGETVISGPIKGTAVTADGLGAKDQAENVMIVDLVRNDLHQVCLPGTVEVTDLLATEHHPGLVHLVSRVRGRLARPATWPGILAATFPPASVSGAPKLAALRLIDELEPVARGPYCGAIGWIDGDRGTASLAVGIRTFWWTDGILRFGTGAGITWGSNPGAEWEETALKSERLIALTSGTLDL